MFPDLPAPPRRVVSLVPSLTESLFDLGLGGCLVGVTDYCIYPVEGVRGLPRLGGTKNPDLAEIVDSRPDLLLANQEENTPAAIHALREAGIPVWLTFPQTVADTLEMLREMAVGFQSPAALASVRALEQAVDWARAAIEPREKVRYFCPIWQDTSASPPGWWMTFNDATYCADVLALFGGENIFAGRQRRYPLAADLGRAEAEPAGERDTRYPRVTREEVLAAGPQCILLPSEPFAYTAEHCKALLEIFEGTPAAQAGRVQCMDGTLITWCGTRLAKAIQQLPDILSELGDKPCAAIPDSV